MSITFPKRLLNPEAPSSGKARLFFADDNGNTRLRYIDDSGVVTDLTAVISGGNRVNFGISFSGSPNLNDVFIFTADVASGLTWRDEDDNEITNASMGDVAQYDGTNWVRQINLASGGVTLTNAQIKTKYEANANTNAFTDAEKTKLENIEANAEVNVNACLLYTSPSPRDRTRSRMPSSA